MLVEALVHLRTLLELVTMKPAAWRVLDRPCLRPLITAVILSVLPGKLMTAPREKPPGNENSLTGEQDVNFPDYFDREVIVSGQLNKFEHVAEFRVVSAPVVNRCPAQDSRLTACLALGGRPPTSRLNIASLMASAAIVSLPGFRRTNSGPPL